MEIKKQSLIMHHKPWSRGFDVYIKAYDVEGKATYFVPGDKLEYQEIEVGAEPYIPTITIPDHEVQELFDVLWNIGLRPSKYVDNAREIKALQSHLHDSQKWAERFWEQLQRPQIVIDGDVK